MRVKRLGKDHPDTLVTAGNLMSLLNEKAARLDDEGASDPATLAQIYTEAADLGALKYGEGHGDVVRCRWRAAELDAASMFHRADYKQLTPVLNVLHA